MRLYQIIIATLLASSSLMPAHAAVVDGLFEAAVPVRDQGAEARNRGLRLALEAVLVKTTGRRDVSGIDALRPLLSDAQRYVQQFRYQQLEVLDPVSGEIRESPHLWVRFDAVGVQRALLARGVPIWGRERPETLVWLAYDDGSARALLSPDSPQLLHRALQKVANDRGIPLITPLMDIVDRTALTYSEVWGGFERNILDASERYGPNAVLVGRIHRIDDDRWTARWSLLEGDTVRYRESPAGPLAAVVSDGAHWTTDLFAERFAVVPDLARSARVRLQVDAVDGFGAYAAALRYLRGLSMVDSVWLESAREDSVLFTMDLRGTVDQLEQAIALGGRLELHPDGHEAEWGAPLLRYRTRQ